MAKFIAVHDRVADELIKMKREYKTEYGEELSYSNAVKELLRISGRWTEPTVKNKSKIKIKSGKAKLKKIKRRSSTDDDEE